jgi:hypothetical protein
MDRQMFFNRVGRGVQETSRVLISGKMENCWLWRESEQRDDGRYPLWSVCFIGTKLMNKGRFFDD